MVAAPLAPGKRPRTLAIRWRAMNSKDWCDGSICQVPTSAPGGRSPRGFRGRADSLTHTGLLLRDGWLGCHIARTTQPES